MNMLGVLSLFILLSATCVADLPSPKYLLVDDYDEDASQLQDRHFDFGTGYTNVTLFDYVVKITAEQRFSDNELLVIVFPQAQGTSFTIHGVRIGKAPRYNLPGAVAQVTGTFKAQVNESNPISRQMTVPVQIAPVQEFTVSENEALIQGNQFIQKQFNHMVTGDEP